MLVNSYEAGLGLGSARGLLVVDGLVWTNHQVRSVTLEFLDGG